MAAAQRLRQGIHALLAFTCAVDYTLAEHYLSPQHLDLFRQMQRSEQLHGLNVLRVVLAQEATTPDDLAIAALLHDVGKIRYPLPVWSKSLAVLVRALMPRRFWRWSEETSANPLKRGCMVMAQHPIWGAELVGSTGVSERVTWLIAHHDETLDRWEDHPDFLLLRRLQNADNVN